MPAKGHLKVVAAEHDVTIRCGHFYSTFGGGPTLSAKLLEMLAELGIKIRVSNYWRDES